VLDRKLLEPIVKRTFTQTSFGFCPNRNAKQALKMVERLIHLGGLKSYFNTMPHDKLMEKVRGQLADLKVLKCEERPEFGSGTAHRKFKSRSDFE
jgi:retron-type reverse transcriptase